VVQSQPGQIVHKTLSPNNPSQKRAAGVTAEDIGPEFTPLYCKNKTKKFIFIKKYPILIGHFFLLGFLNQGLAIYPRLAWILLLLPSECWEHRHVPQSLASLVYNKTVYVNKTHLSDSRFQQQKAEAGQQQLRQRQLLLAVGSTAYYHKLQQELWILHMSMSPEEKE
jgi:hypothetical protein